MAALPDPYMLRDKHPAVKQFGYRKTSERDSGYNCIAWAAGTTDTIWWPLQKVEGCYWPPNAPCEDEGINTFVAGFSTLGYQPCENGELEPGYEKVAIYVKNGGVVHMARQLDNGEWTTKWGMGIDFSHCIKALEDSEQHGPSMYGKVQKYLKRQNV